MAYNPTTAVPNFSSFQWATPDFPNPRLAAPIDDTTTTLTFIAPPLDHAGAVVVLAFLMGIRNSTGYVETVYVPAAALSADGLTATGVTRGINLEGLDFTTGNPDLAQAADQSSTVFCNISGILQAINQNGLRAGIGANIKFNGRPLFMGSGVCSVPVFADATARDAAITAPANGDQCYLTSTGLFYDYTAGAWVARASGGTFPNMSTSVAGKGQVATTGEVNAGTATGSTGAPLVVTPDHLLASNYGPLSVPAGAAVDGSSTPQAVYISDGTNSLTAGRFYKADSNDTTSVTGKVTGFVTTNASSAGTNYNVYIQGIIPGFSGLTPGKIYYLSTTAGAITATVPAGDAQSIPVGLAVSATQLQLTSLERSGPMPFYWSTTGVAVGTSTQTLATNFRVKCAYFTIYINNSNAANSAGATAIFNGAWTDTPGTVNQWIGTITRADRTAAVFSNIDYVQAAPTASGASGNFSTITIGFSTSASVFTASIINAIGGGTGSTNNIVNISAILFPY